MSLKLYLNGNYIYLKYHNKGRYQMSTGESCNTSDWNDKKQECRPSHPSAKAVNSFLERIKTECPSVVRDLLNEGKSVTQDSFKKELMNRVRFRKSITDVTLISFADDLLKMSIKGESRSACLKATLEKLKKFKGDKNFSDIDKHFYESFCNQFQQYSLNTLNRDCANIRYFMNEAVEKGLTTNFKYRTTKFKTPSEEVQSIYLTEQELMQMYMLDLSDEPAMSNARDLFLFAAFTGQRFSDVERYTPEDFKGDILTIRQLKGKELATVPIDNILKDIIKKRGMPKSITNRYVNTLLPEIGFKAGIRENVSITRTVKGKLKTENKPKYTLIKTHCGRRSFITNCIKRGISIDRIRLMTGHSPNSASFQRYNRLSAAENAAQLKDHEMFKKKEYKAVLRKVG